MDVIIKIYREIGGDTKDSLINNILDYYYDVEYFQDIETRYHGYNVINIHTTKRRITTLKYSNNKITEKCIIKKYI